ncbi:MAG: CPBP family intramembrane glutamic endopeptidase [Candidatus Promineifilaceae bacterium]|nr:CPBP family intramembrane glutamic endopeptidase [Candidatus Promineifilaceae bacterium]
MDKLDIRRVVIYLLVAFGFSWTMALVIFLSGGYAQSPAVIPNTPITTAFLVTILYMAGPTVGNLAARILTREGLSNLWLRPKLRQGWKYWIIAWLLTPVLTLGGAILYFLLFPSNFSLDFLTSDSVPGLANSGVPSWLVVVSIAASAILVSPLVNGLATLGEEFGWRAYLQPKLLPLGEKRTYILVGIFWGMWHWPLIWMGFNYPGHPILGSLAMIWFTFLIGTFLGWATLHAGSVWPAVIGHAVINGLAGLPVLFLAGQSNPLVGPLAPGIIGSALFMLAAILIFRGADQ